MRPCSSRCSYLRTAKMFSRNIFASRSGNRRGVRIDLKIDFHFLCFRLLSLFSSSLPSTHPLFLSTRFPSISLFLFLFPCRLSIQFYQEKGKQFRVYGKINDRNEPGNSEHAATFPEKLPRFASDSQRCLQLRNSNVTENPERMCERLEDASAKLLRFS